MSTDGTELARLHGLDALRGGALLLGLLLHAAMAYFPGPQLWVVNDAAESPVASVLFWVIHLFRMPLFFLLAGYFAARSLARRGVVAFAVDRLKRVGGPLAVFWTPVMAGVVATLIWGAYVAAGNSFPKNAPPPPPLTPETFPFFHLWFLYVLVLLYVVAIAVHTLTVAVDRGGGLRRFLARATAVVALLPVPALLALPTAAALYFHPKWYAWFGVPTPDTGIVPNVAAMFVFGLAFALGWQVAARPELWSLWARRWAWNLLLACGFGAAALYLIGGTTPVLEPLTDDGRKAAYACTFAFALWTAVFAVAGLAVRFLDRESGWRRYLADASYWIYVVHLPLTMAGSVLVLNAPWPWFAKFGAVVGGTFLVSIVSYELLVRHTVVGGWLNGRRVPWRRAAARPDAVPAR